jgi:large subunit ribosomal protein L9
VKVVLRNDITGVGRKGDLLDVADGYARNFLLPKGLALVATPGVEAQAEAMRKARLQRSASERADAIELADKLGGTTVRVTAKAGAGGKLFGSVSTSDIANALAAQTGAQVDRRSISVSEAIKSIGSYTVVAHLHADVEINLNVDVVAQ